MWIYSFAGPLAHHGWLSVEAIRRLLVPNLRFLLSLGRLQPSQMCLKKTETVVRKQTSLRPTLGLMIENGVNDISRHRFCTITENKLRICTNETPYRKFINY